MDHNPTTTTWGVDDQSWLASRHGVGNGRSITLDSSSFTEATHYPSGWLRSGTPLGKITATGLYGPYAAQTNEVQTVTVTGSPTGGSFTLTWSGQTTAAIAWNATASAVQTALENLSNLYPGDVTVTGGPAPGTAFTVTFGGTQAGTDVAAMTATASLTGGTTPGVTIATATAGGAAPGTSDGRETLSGHLLYPVSMPTDTTHDVSGSLLVHGMVVAGNLPIPVDTAGRTDVAGRILYV